MSNKLNTGKSAAAITIGALQFISNISDIEILLLAKKKGKNEYRHALAFVRQYPFITRKAFFYLICQKLEVFLK